MWKNHIVYESIPHSVVITLGYQLYRVPEVVPNIAVSLIYVKKCKEVVSHSEGEWKVTATTKTYAWGFSTQQQ
jgi:hypothetical protein